MTGIRETGLTDFHRIVRGRLGNVGVLAEFAGVGRCHLSSMLHGDCARGVYTWAKVRRMVTAVEWSFLEKCSAWNSFQQRFPEEADRARRTPAVDDPRDPLMHVVCADCGHAIKLLKCAADRGGKISHGLCTVCFRGKMAALIPPAELEQRVAAIGAMDAADPNVVPLRPAVDTELSLSPA